MLETACVDPVETFVRRKALQVPDFPQKEVRLGDHPLRGLGLAS